MNRNWRVHSVPPWIKIIILIKKKTSYAHAYICVCILDTYLPIVVGVFYFILHVHGHWPPVSPSLSFLYLLNGLNTLIWCAFLSFLWRIVKNSSLLKSWSSPSHLIIPRMKRDDWPTDWTGKGEASCSVFFSFFSLFFLF